MPTEEYPWRASCVRLEADVSRLQGEIKELRAERDGLQSLIDEHAHRRHGASGMCCRLRENLRVKLDIANQAINAATVQMQTLHEEHLQELEAVTRERDEAREQLQSTLNDNSRHCRDCCCARAWKALGITEYTGRSIPEEIEHLRTQLHVRDELLKLHMERAEEARKAARFYRDGMDKRAILNRAARSRWPWLEEKT